jgi:LAO/AO transport system kinase
MESVALDPGVFIRSMATRGSLGGLATTTREVCDVLDAGGFDRILIETVGVGQSELDVARSADTTILVLVPESGDGIQTLKSGIMEIGDIFVVNKADRPGADRLRHEIEVTLGIRAGNAFKDVKAHHGVKLTAGAAGRAGAAEEAGVAGNSTKSHTPPAAAASPAAPTWTHPVLTTIAMKGEGISELVTAVDAHYVDLEKSGDLMNRRRRRLFDRTREVVDRATRLWVWQETNAEQLIRDRLEELAHGRVSPYEVANEVLDALKQGSRV